MADHGADQTGASVFARLVDDWQSRGDEDDLRPLIAAKVAKSLAVESDPPASAAGTPYKGEHPDDQRRRHEWEMTEETHRAGIQRVREERATSSWRIFQRVGPIVFLTGLWADTILQIPASGGGEVARIALAASGTGMISVTTLLPRPRKRRSPRHAAKRRSKD